MASFVCASGLLGDKIKENVRLIKIESLKNNNPREPIYECIPCMFWNRESNNALTRFPEGTNVLIKGRIENDEDIGAYILIESLTYLNAGTSEKLPL